MDRREFLACGAAFALRFPRSAAGDVAATARVDKAGRPAWQRAMPTAAHLLWQRDELALFLHFGVNTFTDREWGDGREDPALFAPARLDAKQWARAARDA